jgi:hypothetical protein
MQKQSHLEEAIAILIQTQASFVSQLAESKRENDKTMKEIRDDFVQIKAMFLRHERILSDLPEAIRQKIGFQPS